MFQLTYLEGNRRFGAVEANGNYGIFWCVLLGVVGEASGLSLLSFLIFLLCAYNGWDKGPCPGHPALVCLFRQHVEVWAGVLASPLVFHIHIHP